LPEFYGPSNEGRKREKENWEIKKGIVAVDVVFVVVVVQGMAAWSVTVVNKKQRQRASRSSEHGEINLMKSEQESFFQFISSCLLCCVCVCVCELKHINCSGPCSLCLTVSSFSLKEQFIIFFSPSSRFC